MEMSALLAESCPGTLAHSYFSSSGSEANESAIKLARRYHRARGADSKYVCLNRWLSYHENAIVARSLVGVTT